MNLQRSLLTIDATIVAKNLAAGIITMARLSNLLTSLEAGLFNLAKIMLKM